MYRLIELEFYWNSPSHVDNSTYKRKHVDPKSGDWFFHYSGVDIALKNEKTGGYGGILIRGLYDVNKKISIKGPMVCAMKLFSGNNAFTQSIKTQIVQHHFPESEIVNKERVGLSSQENNSHKLDYAFLINLTNNH